METEVTFQAQIKQLGMAYFKSGLIVGLAGGFATDCILAVTLSVVLK
jgi:predicted ATP-grasp superfamily ATP-dependent carboligase